ncbi:MAG: glycoside hydrolase family 2 [Dysgonamonadaceae bacterium]|jgi:hypothetical protein|nr:glycoside hydrolase family 2 [Dysgonamonadaceae bacterium]
MKKNTCRRFAFFILLACFSSYGQKNKLTSGFMNPPDSIQTSAYWYWISDHLSEEGVINDLRAMKQAGINRAFIGNIGLTDAGLEGGRIKFGSEEWWQILHTAIKTASELGIDIGLFNAPGWSQSGGPWVKPNQAMRYLASTKMQVKGGQAIDWILDQPSADFEDVKLIAYPVPKMQCKQLLMRNVKPQNTGQDLVLDFQSEADFTLRTVKIITSEHPVNTPAKIQFKENGQFKTISEFTIDRYNNSLNVGFAPFAPVVISTPVVTAKEFRLIIAGVSPEMGFKEIELSTIPAVERYPEKSLAKMFQHPLPYWNEYQWKKQAEIEDESLVIAPEQVMDISANLSGNRLKWNVPPGDWIVMRTGMLPTGVTNAPASCEATGLEIDKMSKKHIASHFNAYMGKVYDRIPEEERKSWKIIVADSYETGGQNFTDNFIADFKAVYGYDLVPFLPVFDGAVVQSQDVSDRFLWDIRRLVADKVAYDYVGGLRDIAHKHGLTTWLENYGHWGFLGEFLQYGGQSDEIGGEFWSEGDLGNIENKAAASCGHIYGKTKISAESFTSAGNTFGRYPALLKQRGDLFFSEGINNSLLHVYIHQPYENKKPGVNAWFGTEFNRFNTWFSQMDLFTTYLKRVNFMLQQGLNVADAAYFIGEDAPKMTGITDPALPKGYQFDYINAEVIENNLTVKNGLLTLPHGTQYKILILPKLETMRPKLLRKIKQLIEDGAVVMGPAPKRSPSLQNYPQADVEVQTLSASLWSQIDGLNIRWARIGKGMIINGMNMQEALDLIHCVPDCKIPVTIPVLYAHRTFKEAEIYFITNQSNQKINFSAEFRVKAMQPEMWNPITGSIRPLPCFSQTETGTDIPLQLDANESAFIVFRNKGKKNAGNKNVDNFPAPQILVNLTTGPWTVNFNKQQRGPEQALILSSLKNLADIEPDSIKFYSGTINYQSNFQLNTLPTGTLFINLNEVYVMAKIKINGQYAGGVWTNPYRVDISDYVKKGVNSIEIEVVNTWVNRIIGDLNLPENERQIGLTSNTWNADSPLQKSGLIGPVYIENFNFASFCRTHE